MAVKKKINFNVDKLRLSFIQPSGLFEKLSQFPTNKYLDYGDSDNAMITTLNYHTAKDTKNIRREYEEYY